MAFLAPGAVVVGAAVLTASPGGEQVTAGEWIAAAVACIVASAAIEAQVSHRVRVKETERLWNDTVVVKSESAPTNDR